MSPEGQTLPIQNLTLGIDFVTFIQPSKAISFLRQIINATDNVHTFSIRNLGQASVLKAF